ncbi:MAG: hypothetical protein HY754_06120 [Nitrospirae bacterium]|nr:hypothetical protein [Nitrospirota bacterium]
MKKIFMFSIVLVTVFLFLHGFVIAETTDENITATDNLMPGTVEGTGTHFAVTDSEYIYCWIQAANIAMQC